MTDANPGVGMKLSFDDADSVATCECGWHTHGDSMNDSVTAWASHLAGTQGRARCPLAGRLA